MKKIINSKVYKCDHCGKTYKSADGLKYHLQFHLEPEKRIRFTCDECDKAFATKQHLEGHRETHLDDEQRMRSCQQCGKKFKSKSGLRLHRATHDDDPDKRKRFSCSQCDSTFSARSSVTQHIKFVHQKLKPHTCDECGSSFPSSYILDQHLQIHVNPNTRQKFHCKECHKFYFTRTGLTQHVKSVHERLGELTCTWSRCNSVAFSRTALRRHIAMVHEKRQQFPCLMKSKDGSCLRMFTTKSEAKRHHDYVHLNILVPCFLASCDRTFSTASKARAHYRREHEGDTAKWRCPHCRKLLCDSNYLLRHIEQVHKTTKCSSSTQEPIRSE